MNAIQLDALPKGMIATITEIITNPHFGEHDDSVSQRLVALGFGQGQTVEVVARGILGTGPYAVRLGNQSQFFLRHAEARKIMCIPIQAA
ncbi:FeoA family protein [Wielerella bovis]|uniref:FeoA family protein n=1 Tax=Wielerella bovis TaxID=2917790 RepID=UPI00201945DA|nr:FeoA family protein [Wielerella bovis]MCG7656326.1 ferrous iron transport protein A [Wielerella bovis]MCG7658551.1 ferrous iron transport protein A [Wielerella bovis]ULJ60660.1 ferrous iron transport protein A [Wielerella bovis]ULJ65081.1 ferrous iron transport protein A [Wielerella bovis]ULJ67355.1 ferrous iron transport protein A [Wielerella bovis]